MSEELTSQEAALIIGIAPETLRKWEISGKLGFKALKTEGGHRRYSKSKIEQYKHEMLNPNKSGYITFPESVDLGHGMTRHYFNDGTGESVVSGGFFAENGEYDPNIFSNTQAAHQLSLLPNNENLGIVSVAGRGDGQWYEKRTVNLKGEAQTLLTFDVIVLYGHESGGMAKASFWPHHAKNVSQYGFSLGLLESELIKEFEELCMNNSFIAEIGTDPNDWLTMKSIKAILDPRLPIPEGHAWRKKPEGAISQDPFGW